MWNNFIYCDWNNDWIVSASVPQTSIIGMPILMTMYLAVQFEPMVENKVIKTMIGYLPTSHIVKALNSLVGGAGFGSISGHVLNVAVWLIISLFVCLIVYKRNIRLKTEPKRSVFLFLSFPRKFYNSYTYFYRFCRKVISYTLYRIREYCSK